jgi:type III pantothenate kinase
VARDTKSRRLADATVLAIDVGNTHTVLGVFRGVELVLFRRVTSGISRTSDELAVLVEALCREQNEAIRAARRVVIASVVPALTEGYETMATRLYAARALAITSRVRAGVRLEVPDPSSLGADRIANAAAVAGGRLPAIVVDLGTATTFDVIRAGRRYAGGAIAPGIRTSSEELFYRAAKLAKVEIRKPARCIGRTTEESIQSGVYYGAIGTVDGIVRRLEAELGRPARVIATGGLAPLVAGGSETIQEVDEALTLRGLLTIERLNRRS